MLTAKYSMADTSNQTNNYPIEIQLFRFNFSEKLDNYQFFSN